MTQSLAYVMRSLNEGFRISVCSDGDEALATTKPDRTVVVLDENTPGPPLPILIAMLRHRTTRLRVILLGTPKMMRPHIAAQFTGAIEYISRSDGLDALRLCLLSDGGGDSPAELSRRSIELSHRSPISPRQHEVLTLLAEGLSNKEIAEGLTISLGTVKRHLEDLYKRLEVSNRSEAIRRGVRMGLVSFDHELDQAM